MAARVLPEASPIQGYVLCLRSDGYEASLEPRKVYPTLADTKAASHSLLRVVDESGEDYLYPADFFVPVELPDAATRLFAGVG